MDLAKEKSEYAHCIATAINNKVSQHIRNNAIIRLSEIEHRVKIIHDDEMIFIVTTKNTNPMPKKSAPPMSMENIKND